MVTEAGFDTEKFMNIKCRYSGSTPHCAVVVATIRALKMQGGGLEIVAGKLRSNACITEKVALVEAGCVNFGQAYISNTKVYGAGA